MENGLDVLVFHDPNEKDEVVVLEFFLQGLLQDERSGWIVSPIQDDPR